jgi:nitric oxide reductase subunit B
MALLTLLPMGVLQLQAALEHGYWYARSAEFTNQPLFDVLVWMRMPGDLVFATGSLLLAWFVFRQWVMPTLAGDPPVDTPIGPEAVPAE